MSPWIVFDAMGVMFKVGDDTRELLIPFIRGKNPEVEDAAILEAYLQASLGRMTSKEFWESLGLGGGFPAVEREYLDTVEVNPEAVQAARGLARRFPLAMLSNDVKEWSARLREKFDLNRLFRL